VITSGACGSSGAIMDRIMAEMMKDAGTEVRLRSSQIREHSREAARCRMRVLEELRRQARAKKRSRGWSKFRKFLMGVAAVVGAAAAAVASPFTGGASVAGYVAGALAITAACAGGAAAAGGMAAGRCDARAATAKLKGESAALDVDSHLGDVGQLSQESFDLVQRAAQVERRAAGIMQREQDLAQIALRSRTC
jgi:hypothetical protein